jgi:transposase, IS30 family
MSRGVGGIPLFDKRALYVELMKTGIGNAAACRRVGVNRKTGVRWTHGRRLKYKSGRTYTYPPINFGTGKPTVGSSRYLSEEDRIVIADGLRRGLSGRRIAGLLPGRAVSTVCREIKRNTDVRTGEYLPHRAHQQMLQRRPRPKLFKLQQDPVLKAAVQERLDKQWSPQQISKSLAAGEVPLRIAAESIYQAIYNPFIVLRREKVLRTRRIQRQGRRTGERRTRRFIVPMTPLAERPPEVADRLVAGHWEGDLIVGVMHQSAIGTLVERKTRYTMLVHLDGIRTSEQLRDAMTARFNELPENASLFWDRFGGVALV